MKENDGLSDFMKFAYSKGRVKKVEEAFEEYPVEDEWHKGKIENLLREEDEKYNTYQIGDIVFVKNYTYNDGKEGKNHLFVIVDQNNMEVPIENFGILISSQLDKLKYKTNRLIEKNKDNGLDKDSIVKTDVIYIIRTDQILFKIGTIDRNKIEEYKNNFYENVE